MWWVVGGGCQYPHYYYYSILLVGMNVTDFILTNTKLTTIFGNNNKSITVEHSIPNIENCTICNDGNHIAIWNGDKTYYFIYNATTNVIMQDSFMKLPIIGRLFPKTLEIEPISKHLWCISHDSLDYDDSSYGVETLFSVESYSDNKIRIYDPWLFPFLRYEISYPKDIRPISIDAWHKYLLIFGIDGYDRCVIAFRKVNFDIAGYNPFVKYMVGDREINSSTFNKFIGNILGIDKTINISFDDIGWKIIQINRTSRSYNLNNSNPNVLNAKIWNDHIYIKMGNMSLYFASIYEINENDVKWHNLQIIDNLPYKVKFMEHVTVSDNFIMPNITNGRIYCEPFYAFDGTAENCVILSYYKYIHDIFMMRKSFVSVKAIDVE